MKVDIGSVFFSCLPVAIGISQYSSDVTLIFFNETFIFGSIFPLHTLPGYSLRTSYLKTTTTTTLISTSVCCHPKRRGRGEGQGARTTMSLTRFDLVHHLVGAILPSFLLLVGAFGSLLEIPSSFLISPPLKPSESDNTQQQQQQQRGLRRCPRPLCRSFVPNNID